MGSGLPLAIDATKERTLDFTSSMPRMFGKGLEILSIQKLKSKVSGHADVTAGSGQPSTTTSCLCFPYNGLHFVLIVG